MAEVEVLNRWMTWPGGLAGAMTLLVGTMSGGASRSVEPSPEDLTRLEAPVAGGRFALGVTTFRVAHHSPDDSCPDGLMGTPQARLLARLPDDLQAELGDPKKIRPLLEMAITAADGNNICSSPSAALAGDSSHPLPEQVRGGLAYGLDLDGAEDGQATTGTCAHAGFTSVETGQKGIDNQLQRAFGCVKRYNTNASLNPNSPRPFDNERQRDPYTAPIVQGEMAIVVEVSNVRNRWNDDEVDVGIYSGATPMKLGTDGILLRNSSITTTGKSQWRTMTKGFIRNGILRTRPADIRLQQIFAGIDAEFIFLRARLEMKLLADGGARGLLAGYRPLTAIYWNDSAGTYARAMATTGSDCTAMYRALHAYADGYPDPETGQCTAISSAQAIQAVPVYVFHPEDRDRAGSAPQARASERR